MEKQHLQQGDIVGHLHIQNRFRKKRTYYYHCHCDCGAEVDVEASRLERRLQTSCRCKGVYLEVGKTYEHLTIQKRIKRGLYEAECSCGNHLQVTTYEILHGHRTSAVVDIFLIVEKHEKIIRRVFEGFLSIIELVSLLHIFKNRVKISIWVHMQPLTRLQPYEKRQNSNYSRNRNTRRKKTSVTM